MKKSDFDKQTARAFCMEYGMIGGLLCGGSFLLSMYGTTSVLLGQMGNILGIIAFITIGQLIRSYGRATHPLTFSQACYMALFTYVFTIMVTAIIQFIYFLHFDGGRLVNQLRTLMEVPEYRQWLSQMASGEDVESLVEQAISGMSNPAQMTLQLMWLNSLLGLLLLIPTAIMGKRK